MFQGNPLLVAELGDRAYLTRVLHAALRHEVLDVPLAEAPRQGGMHRLRVLVGGSPVISLAAEPLGPGKERLYALRLRPLDPSHLGELYAMLGESVPPPSPSKSLYDSSPPLPPGGVLHPSSAPARSAPPSRAPSVRPPLQTLRDDESTKRAFEHPLAAAPAAVEDRSISISVDFSAPVSSEPEPRRPFESEPELAGSVVIDPDVMSRERQSRPTPARVDPADEDGVSVVFEPSNTTRLASLVPPSEDDETDLATMQYSSELHGVPSSRTTRARIAGFNSIALAPGRSLGGKYTIASQMGTGAVGTVYKASHEALGRDVAIKVLHPHCRNDPHLFAAFQAEARATGALSHPNVLTVHDYGEEPDGIVYIVMEYLDGSSLQSLLDSATRIPAARAVAILVQVCSALAAAHDRGIIHRDVKPDNIMLLAPLGDDEAAKDFVKVCDFGIAAAVTKSDEEFTAGTPEYMAPEQARGQADARSDVYACGIMLYEMLSGAPPFREASARATLARHLKDAPAPLGSRVAGIPPVLEAIVRRTLEKTPERRFQTMRELRTELRRVVIK